MTVTPEYLPMNMVIPIYTTNEVGGFYLYLDRNKGLDSVPDTLQTLTGEPVEVFDQHMPHEYHFIAAKGIDASESLDGLEYSSLPKLPFYQKDDSAITLPDAFYAF